MWLFIDFYHQLHQMNFRPVVNTEHVYGGNDFSAFSHFRNRYLRSVNECALRRILRSGPDVGQHWSTDYLRIGLLQFAQTQCTSLQTHKWKCFPSLQMSVSTSLLGLTVSLIDSSLDLHIQLKLFLKCRRLLYRTSRCVQYPTNSLPLQINYRIYSNIHCKPRVTFFSILKCGLRGYEPYIFLVTGCLYIVCVSSFTLFYLVSKIEWSQIENQINASAGWKYETKPNLN